MGFNGTSRALAAVLGATAVALTATAADATGPAGHLILNPGKGGANTVWISGNDAGQAVGQKLTGSVSDFVYFDGRHPHDLTPRLGHGAFASIDPLGEAAGTTSTGFPLYYATRSRRKVVLPMAGRATGIALGPLVAVTLSNGTAELWNPLSGGTLSLGQASTTGVNASGTVVGHAPDGNLWYSVPNRTGGATQTELPVQGNFDRVNNQNVATGYERTSGRLLPVRFTIPATTAASAHAATTGLTVYRLLPGYADGVLTGINDIGTVAFGNVGHNNMIVPSAAAFWPVPDGPKKAPLKDLIAGVYKHFSSAVSYYNDIGWFGGEITVKRRDIAYLFEPRPLFKLVGLEKTVLEAKWVSASTETAVRKRLSNIHNLLAKGNRKAACAKMLVLPLGDEKAYLATVEGADTTLSIDLYDNLADGLWDLANELDCLPHVKSAIEGLLLSPNDTQSPYAGTPLAWNSPVY